MLKKRVIYRILLIIVYIISLLLMIGDIIIEPTEAIVFYVLANSILLFRIGGVNIITKIVHFVANIFLIAVLIYLVSVGDAAFITSLLILIPLTIQLIFALHLMFFRPGKTYLQRAQRAGIHALLGIMVIIVVFLCCCFIIVNDGLQTALEISYFLLFLFMLLTPHFQTLTHAASVAKYGPCQDTPSCPGKQSPNKTKTSPANENVCYCASTNTEETCKRLSVKSSCTAPKTGTRRRTY